MVDQSASLLARLKKPADFEHLCAELLKRQGFAILKQVSEPDNGIDIVAVKTGQDIAGFPIELRMAVECRYMADGRVLTERATESVIERTLESNCNRYLLITSTTTSKSARSQLRAIAYNPSIRLSAHTWGGREIERQLGKHPDLVKKYFAKRNAARTPARSTRRSVFVHLHPDFQDELLQLFKVWNEIQDVLRFNPIRPTRTEEAALLRRSPVEDVDALDLARMLRKEEGLKRIDAIVLFCEGNLYDNEADRLFSVTDATHNESIISLEKSRNLVASGKLKGSPIFSVLVHLLLGTLGDHHGLDTHQRTLGCCMDYCNNMDDIAVGLSGGPKFCPQCEAHLEDNEHSHLIKLAHAFNEIQTKAIDKTINNRMRLRSERHESRLVKEAYDVALSFAGEDRDKACALLAHLKHLGVKTFYDDFERVDLWGEDLYAYLSDLYRFQATYCVMFLSKHYGKKLWTNHERKAAQERAFRENRAYILPIRLDDTDVPGMLSTIGELRWEEESPRTIAGMINEKLRRYNATSGYSAKFA